LNRRCEGLTSAAEAALIGKYLIAGLKACATDYLRHRLPAPPDYLRHRITCATGYAAVYVTS
jgi:hypothetical protein